MKKTNFRSFYAPLIPTLRNVGYCAQVVSGMTAAVGVWAVVFPRLQIFGNIAAGIIAALLTLLCIYVIEGGLRTFLPFTLRQAVRAEFGNRWFVGMFAPLAVVTVLLFSATSLLSWFASPEIVTAATPAPELHDLSEAKAEELAHRERIAKDYDNKRADMVATHESKIQAVRDEYRAKISRKRKHAQRCKDNDPDGCAWLINHVIPKLKEEREKQIVYIEGLKADALAAIGNKMDEELAHHRQHFALVLEDKHSTNAATLSKHENGRSLWGSALAVFALACGFILLFSFLLEEVYNAGSEPVKPPAPKLQPIAATETRPHVEFQIVETRGVETVKPKPDTVKPTETIDGSEIQETPEPTVLIPGFKDAMNARQIRKKIQQYRWKLREGKGKPETNNRNLLKLIAALETIQGK